jgi:hypothetical protein
MGMGIFDKRKKTSGKPPIVAASGGVVRGGNPANPESIIRRTENWQQRTLAFRKSIPEVAHASLFVNNTTKKCRLVCTGTGTNDSALTRQLSSLDIGRAASNIFLVGEVILAYRYDRIAKKTAWKVIGKGDYKYENQNKPLLVRGDNGKMAPLGNEWKWFRVWRPDPDREDRAWSTHEALLDVLEAMYVHQLADTAIGTSRLAGAGIIYIPNDEFVEGPDLDGGEPEPGTQAHFEQRLRGAMSDSIRDRDTQDAYVPVIMFGSSEFSDGLRHLMTERADDADAFASRMSSYAKRYGDGIDLPTEVITGMGGTNHWAGWKVDQNTANYYLIPIVDIIAKAVEENFVYPTAKNLGDKGDAHVIVDATEMVVKPDRTDAAIRMFATGALSGEGALHYAGMDDKFIHPHANDPRSTGRLGNQPDGAVRMPSSNFRDSEGEPVGDRNLER